VAPTSCAWAALRQPSDQPREQRGSLVLGIEFNGKSRAIALAKLAAILAGQQVAGQRVVNYSTKDRLIDGADSVASVRRCRLSVTSACTCLLSVTSRVVPHSRLA
jgi:hypothetical protein